MKHYITSLCVALLACLLHSCGVQPTHFYSAKLQSARVEGIESVKGDIDSDKYSDSIVEVSFSFRYNRVDLRVSNKSNETLILDWDKCAYIDAAGVAMRVIHAGVTFASKSQLQAPTVIPSESHVIDLIMPTENVSLSKTGWDTKLLLESAYRNEISMLGDSRTNRVVLAFKKSGKVIYYDFTFPITRQENPKAKKPKPMENRNRM